MKNLKKSFILLICIIVVFTMTACKIRINFGKTDDTNPSTAESSDGDHLPEIPESSGSQKVSDGRSDLIPEYEHYDPTDFNSMCEELVTLSDAGDTAALDLYDVLKKQLEYILTLSSVSYITYLEDVTNEENQREYEYTDELHTNCSDKLFSSLNKLATGKIADDFRKHLNDDNLFDAFAEYEPMTPEEKELEKEETQLENEYQTIMDGFDNYSCKYKNNTYYLGDFYDADSGLSDLDADSYYEIFENCIKQLNEDAGEVYLKLVQIRNRLAEIRGYDNYSEYADSEVYSRDYTAIDLESLKNAVKSACYSDYYNNLYSYLYYYGFPQTELSVSQVMDSCGSIISEISDYAGSAFDYMEENHLYSLGSEECRSDGYGTTVLYYPENNPFVVGKLDSGVSSIFSMIHESGHFTRNYTVPLGIFSTFNLDLDETHSTGLVVLSLEKLNEKYGKEEASTLYLFEVLRLLVTLSDGCIYDDWQRLVYENPDMSLEEINDAYEETCQEYGVESTPGSKYTWAIIPHHFDSPMYYISYAVSAATSLQIWQTSRSDYDEAVNIWEYFITADNETGYLEIVEKSNLATFRDSLKMEELLEYAYNYIAASISGSFWQ